MFMYQRYGREFWAGAMAAAAMASRQLAEEELEGEAGASRYRLGISDHQRVCIL